MTKTSQQIAEEMATATAVERLRKGGVSTFDAVMESIPLAQLIEVARAANRVEETNCECTCFSDPERSCRYCGYFISLGKTLKALKQTGKAEWLNS